MNTQLLQILLISQIQRDYTPQTCFVFEEAIIAHMT